MEMWQLFVSSFERAPWGWGMFAGGIYAWFKIWPVLQEKLIGEHAIIRKEYVAQLAELKDEVTALRHENAELRKEVGDLRVQLAGQKSQSIAVQAASIRHAPAIREAVQDVVRDTQSEKK